MEGEPNKYLEAVRALRLYRLRQFDQSVEICNDYLRVNALDMSMWYIKCRSLIGKDWIDDTDIEEEGAAEILLEEGRGIAENARPGTSLKVVAKSDQPGVHPSSKSGRISTGYVRPSTSQREQSGKVEDVFKGNRLNTARPVSSSGRFKRLMTASLASTPGAAQFIDPERINVEKYSKKDREALAKALCDYLLFVSHNPRVAFELASKATEEYKYEDWWWQNRLGKAYYKMGLWRDSERQYRASLRNQDMVRTYLQLAKVFIRMNQPKNAIDVYSKGSHNHPNDTQLIIRKARVYEALGDFKKTLSFYEKALEFNAGNVESIACIASNAFYEDQPEVALRLYRRLLQMGVNNANIWNNVGLCCFYASQYDLALPCFEKALLLADDSNLADVWYNIGHVGIGIGDQTLAFEAFKIAINIDPQHVESLNCLGVIEMRQKNFLKARNYLESAKKHCGMMHEPIFNLAVVCYHVGKLKDCSDNLSAVLEIYPKHHESVELMKDLKKKFN